MSKIEKLLKIIILIIAILLIPQKVHAAGLQAKGGTSKGNTTASDFFTLIQAMGTTSGTLGVNNSSSIDCHMAKNTEWGTAAMLAVSKYGSNSNNTTTGDKSGIYNMADGKSEYTANYLTGNTRDFAANITGAAAKYKNEYTSGSTRIAGDGLDLGTITHSWSVDYPVLARGNRSLFAYIGGKYQTSTYYGGGPAISSFGSRAVVVCGSGL